MTAVNCPMCELRFSNRNERDWHLRNEHEHIHPHAPATDRPDVWWRRAAAAADVQPDQDRRPDEPKPR